jgi:hypothetical protein
MIALALRRGSRHHAGNFAEDGADTGGHARHDSARGNRHETRHKRVFDQVLTFGIFPYFQLQNHICDLCHCFSSPLRWIRPSLLVSYHPNPVREIRVSP